MSLRDEAITHMAQALPLTQPAFWSLLSNESKAVYLEGATVALDALLDFLTEHVKEWDAESFSLYAWKPEGEPPKIGAMYHIAALRGTTGKP